MRAAAWLLLAGCGSGPPWARVDVNTAQSVVGVGAQLIDAQRMGDAPSVSGSVDLLVAQSQFLVQPEGMTPIVKGLYAVNVGVVTGMAGCDASGCTFDRFGGSSDTGETWQTSGSVTPSGDGITIDLTHDDDGSLGAMAWTIDGALSLDRQRLGGTVHAHGVSMDVIWDVVVELGPAVLDQSDCAIGGSLHALTKYIDDTGDLGSDGQPSFDMQGDLAFDPVCPRSSEP